MLVCTKSKVHLPSLQNDHVLSNPTPSFFEVVFGLVGNTLLLGCHGKLWGPDLLVDFCHGTQKSNRGFNTLDFFSLHQITRRVDSKTCDFEIGIESLILSRAIVTFGFL